MEAIMIYRHLNGTPLQNWYAIEIVTDNKTNTKYVFFHSRIHVNKKVELFPCFSTDFTDAEILRDRDLLTNIYSRYGVDIFQSPP